MKEDFVLIDLMQIKSTTFVLPFLSSSLDMTLWYKKWTATDLFYVSSKCEILSI